MSGSRFRVPGPPPQQLFRYGLAEGDAAGLGRPFRNVVEGVVQSRVEVVREARVDVDEDAMRGDCGRGCGVSSGGGTHVRA